MATRARLEVRIEALELVIERQQTMLKRSARALKQAAEVIVKVETRLEALENKPAGVGP